MKSHLGSQGDAGGDDDQHDEHIKERKCNYRVDPNPEWIFAEKRSNISLFAINKPFCLFVFFAFFVFLQWRVSYVVEKYKWGVGVNQAFKSKPTRVDSIPPPTHPPTFLHFQINENANVGREPGNVSPFQFKKSTSNWRKTLFIEIALFFYLSTQLSQKSMNKFDICFYHDLIWWFYSEGLFDNWFWRMKGSYCHYYLNIWFFDEFYSEGWCVRNHKGGVCLSSGNFLGEVWPLENALLHIIGDDDDDGGGGGDDVVSDHRKNHSEKVTFKKLNWSLF